MSTNKIAICMSGAPREFKSCYPYFKKNVLEATDYTYDIFISCWNHVKPQYKNFYKDEGTFDEVLDLYKPKSYNYEVYDQKKEDELANECELYKFQSFTGCKCKKQIIKCRRCGGLNAHNQLGMLYNTWKAQELCKIENLTKMVRSYVVASTNPYYDYVIKTRPDNLVLEPLDEKYFNLENNVIFIPKEKGIDNTCKYGSGPNDQFAVGTFGAMCIYAHVYNHIYDYLMENYEKCGGWSLPHRALGMHLKKNNIELLRLPYKCCLYRKKQKFYNIQ